MTHLGHTFNVAHKQSPKFRFALVKEHLVEFNQLALANADGNEDMLNRVMPKDNIGLAVLLETRPGCYEGTGEK